MSLSSVVNGLVRAAAGVPQDISDADLDKHVAELLAAEAKKRDQQWSQLGLSALLDKAGRDSLIRWSSTDLRPDPSLPKPNKRFLATVIRQVDGHNSHVIRAQAAAARDAREERFYNDWDMQDSPRAEGSRGGRRLLSGALKSVRKEDNWAHDRFDRAEAEYRARRRERKEDERRELEEETLNGGSSRRRERRHRSESDRDHSEKRRRQSEADDEGRNLEGEVHTGGEERKDRRSHMDNALDSVQNEKRLDTKRSREQDRERRSRASAADAERRGYDEQLNSRGKPRRKGRTHAWTPTPEPSSPEPEHSKMKTKKPKTEIPPPPMEKAPTPPPERSPSPPFTSDIQDGQILCHFL